ncbi:hypothetical protein TRFO_37735 [Tritrichomonas foetus]|uniref:Importin N-terminal domain-containing protein n=1 Tax=Tritrichomonas foetus TaxID=1144522 RepID=A0A1J4JBT6_9EUKA|nr:hypothetical protein TRFO_37735 [Tritrichomonas foetus]|eukprot:OHS96121.1 hypothetical protein TRFO_37735 [Tritrichomonas foetus]
MTINTLFNVGMSFDIPTIELASISMYKGDLKTQQKASSFLMEWQNSPDSINLAFEILLNSECSKFAKNSACSSIVNFSNVFYHNIEQESKINFRSKILEILFQNIKTENSELICNQIISSIINILLFDWPINWPEFPFGIFQLNEKESSKILIHIFNGLFFTLHNSMKVTTSRKYILIDAIRTISNQIIDIVFSVISLDLSLFQNYQLESPIFEVLDRKCFKEGMGILNFLVKILPIESFHNNFVLNQIIMSIYSQNDEFQKEWLHFCKKLVLWNRKIVFIEFLKPILTSISNIHNLTSSISKYLINILKNEMIFTLDNHEFNLLLSHQFLRIVNLQFLETSLLHDFWIAWENLLMHENPQIWNNVPFQNFLPLFEKLPFSTNFGFIQDKTPIFVIKRLYTRFNIDFNNYLQNFLLLTKTLPDHFWLTVGIVWDDMEKDEENEIACKIYSTIELTQIEPSTIFCLVSCIRFLQKNQEAQLFLVNLFVELLNQRKFIETLSFAFKFLTKNLPEIFLINDFFLVNCIMTHFTSLLLEFEDSGIQILKSVCIAVIKAENEEHKNLILKNFSDQINNLLGFDQTLYIGLQCLEKLPPGNPIFLILFPKLISLSQKLFDESFPMIDITNSFINCLSKLFISFFHQTSTLTNQETNQHKRWSGVILDILRLLFLKPHLYVQTFSLIKELRKWNDKFEDMFPEILNSLVFPYLIKNHCCLDEEYFEMISQFSSQFILADDLLSNSIVHGMKDLRENVVKSSIKCLILNLNHIEEENLFSDVKLLRFFLRPIFESLLDMIHSSSFKHYSKILKFLFVRNTKQNKNLEVLFVEEITGIFSSISLKESCQQAYHELNQTHSQKDKFRETLHDFILYVGQS